MEKKTKTIWTIIIGAIILALLGVILYRFWMFAITAGIAFLFGYFFGYRNHRPKKTI